MQWPAAGTLAQPVLLLYGVLALTSSAQSITFALLHHADRVHGCWVAPTWCHLLTQTSHACFVKACTALSACCSPYRHSGLSCCPASKCSPVLSCRTIALAAPCPAPPLPRGPVRCRLGAPARQSRSPQGSPALGACPRKWDQATLSCCAWSARAPLARQASVKYGLSGCSVLCCQAESSRAPWDQWPKPLL